MAEVWVVAAGASTLWQRACPHVAGMTVRQVLVSLGLLGDSERGGVAPAWPEELRLAGFAPLNEADLSPADEHHHRSTVGFLGLWGRHCTLDEVVLAGDRIELYRPLLIDPKQSRRRRAHQQRLNVQAAGGRVSRWHRA